MEAVMALRAVMALAVSGPGYTGRLSGPGLVGERSITHTAPYVIQHSYSATYADIKRGAQRPHRSRLPGRWGAAHTTPPPCTERHKAIVDHSGPPDCRRAG